MSADSSGNGHIAKCNSPLNTTDSCADSSGNGHRLKTVRPTIPHGGIGGGGLGGQQFKSLENVVKRLDRLGINFAHIMQVNLGMDTG